jgi:hypothetical protein
LRFGNISFWTGVSPVDQVALQENRQRGLPSLQESKLQRRRAIVFGKVRIREAAPQFWLWTVVIFVAFGVVYWNISERELQTRKSAVMAKQRAVAKELSPRLTPLRDRVEGWVQELAGDWNEGVISPDLSAAKLQNSKGLYLRLLIDNAKDPERIRKGATVSLHDGFTSCLFARSEKTSAPDGSRCFSSGQCQAGELCNDWHVCSPPTQPFNLRLMYRAMRVLSSDWSDDLHKATDEWQVRTFENDLEKVMRDDITIAAQLTSGAKYFTALLDVIPKQGLPPEVPGEDPEGMNRPELRVQQVDHPVRLGVWDLESGAQLVRLKIDAGAQFVPMGRMKTSSEETQRAQQRQVNNCSIAAELRERLNSAP